jgi:hypothetical protein
MAENEQTGVGVQVQVRDIPGSTEHRFASGFDIAQPGTMVYLDFYQQNPRDQTQAQYISQVVMLPSLAKLLAAKLSDVQMH